MVITGGVIQKGCDMEQVLAGGERITISVRVEAVLEMNGEDRVVLQEHMQRSFERAIGMGALTGETYAEVEEHSMTLTAMNEAEAALDEAKVEAWIAGQIESGSMRLEDVCKLMARYALADPAEMRMELAERMGLDERGDQEEEVLATVKSSDGVMFVSLAVNSWLSQASDEDITQLREEGFASDFMTDEVARFYEDSNAKVAALLQHCRREKGGKHVPSGFECEVQAQGVMCWLKTRRPGLWAMFVCEDQAVDLVQASEEEVAGRWDWLDGLGNASDTSFETEGEAALDAVKTLGLEGN